jgi:hypothetical protein
MRSAPIGMSPGRRMEGVLSRASATVRLMRSMRFPIRERLRNLPRRTVSTPIRNRSAGIADASKRPTTTTGQANSCRVAASADRIMNIDGVPDGYRAMNDREAIKVGDMLHQPLPAGDRTSRFQTSRFHNTFSFLGRPRT